MRFLAAEQIHAKDNKFCALRLFFACLVIFSHSPAILSGSRAFQPHFGPLTFGEVAVDGFFLISGYLITKSYLGCSNLTDYFRKRVLRIYPGFAVNVLVCVFLLAPFVGAGASVFKLTSILETSLRLGILSFPKLPNIFPGFPKLVMNGSAWTIAYEFRCYILVAVLGLVAEPRRWRLGILPRPSHV